MNRNIGKRDKQIRLLFVLVVAILGAFKLITNDTVASILAVISIAFIVTILLNFSPIYRLFGCWLIGKRIYYVLYLNHHISSLW